MGEVIILLDFMKVIFAFIKDWADVFLIAVGLSAFIIYFWQKRDQKRIAATLIKGQIDGIEKVIIDLKEDEQLGNVSMYQSRVILNDNLWEKYKHLFVKSLSDAEIEIIQTFYDKAEMLENLRSSVVQVINNAWEHKSLVDHLICGRIINNEKPETLIDNPETVQKVLHNFDVFRANFESIDIVFTPDIVKNRIVKVLNNMTMISGTTAYDKIYKLSYEKKR